MTTGHAYTQVRGHGLQAEGKPFVPAAHSSDMYNLPGWTRTEGREGHAVCSCGEASGVLGSDADRKRWYNDHKEQR